MRHKNKYHDRSERFFEIDFLRGAAIILMVLYHLAFDLYLFGYNISLIGSGYVKAVGAIAGILFVFLVGFSLNISFSKSQSFDKYLKRGLFIFGLGLLITLATYLVYRDQYILFGVLHLIGISIVLAYFFRKLGNWNYLIGLIFISLGLFLKHKIFTFSSLLIFGFMPYGFNSLDYYPLLPWFGVVLIGLALGGNLYPKGKRSELVNAFRKIQPNILTKTMIFLGRNSLIIYLIHQPILFAILKLIGA